MRASVLLAVLAILASSTMARAESTAATVARTVLLKYRAGTVAAPGRLPQDLKEELARLGLEVVSVMPQIRWIEARSIGETQVSDDILEQLAAIPSIEIAERDQLWKADAVPNDPMYAEQAALRRFGAESAWARTTGSAGVVVAVSDSGVALAHPDLADRLWTNPGEIAGNGADDDGNGYVDDVHGYDFADNDGAPDDGNGHGTHVAGTIGAAGDNGLGVTGVNWDVRIMAVRFLDSSGSGSNANGVKTILYAVDHGARIINMSWGGGGYTDALKDALQYAHDKNVLALAAAGNNSEDADQKPHYPSSYEVGTLISVASSQADGKFSGFSNFGRVSVDLAAPGSNILATYPPDSYKRLSGTSMATPMAAGAAALVLAEHPSIEVTHLRNALLNAVVAREAYDGRLATEGDLDANLALTQFDGAFAVWPGAITLGDGSRFRFTAHGASGAVTWAVTPSSHAEIAPDGTLTAKKTGSVTVTAKDATGAVANTARVEIADPAKGGGGCSRAPGEREDATLGLGLPLLAGLLLRRRKRA